MNEEIILPAVLKDYCRQVLLVQSQRIMKNYWLMEQIGMQQWECWKEPGNPLLH